MALNPQERKDFILQAMIGIANGVLSNRDLLKAMAATERTGGPDRVIQVGDLVYNAATVLADKYDQENP